MPRYSSEYFYTWGYGLTSLVLLLVSITASIAIIRQWSSIGAWLLVAGAILTMASLTVDDLGWLILAGGDNVIDGVDEELRGEILDALRPIETGMSYFGALAIVLSLLFLNRDFGALRRHTERTKMQNKAEMATPRKPSD